MAKITSKGTLLKKSISASYTTIAAIRRLTAPDAEVEVYDATALDSSTGREKKITGFVDGGKCSGELFFDPVATTHQELTDQINTPADGQLYKIFWSDAAVTEWPWTGCLTKFTPRAAVGEGLMADFEITVDGKVTYP